MQNAERRRTLAVVGNRYPPFLVICWYAGWSLQEVGGGSIAERCSARGCTASPKAPQVLYGAAAPADRMRAGLTPLSLCDISPFRGAKKTLLALSHRRGGLIFMGSYNEIVNLVPAHAAEAHPLSRATKDAKRSVSLLALSAPWYSRIPPPTADLPKRFGLCLLTAHINGALHYFY